MNEILPLLTPDAARRERTVSRCHRALAHRRRRAETAESGASRTQLAIESVLLAGFCVTYLIVLAGDIVSFYR
jgi:hypothetical protein